jgi:CubicO group peptidase (beta-lactamase class C family)
MLLLGTAIKMRTGKSIKYLIKKYIFEPLNLNDTQYSNTQNIKDPVFHTFTNNRISYYEDSTFWNPSWGSYASKINSNANDVNIIGKSIGSGKLISKELYNIQMSNPDITTKEYYGMGVVVGGFGLDNLTTKKFPYPVIWTNESEDGNFGIWAYIPKKRITINIQTNTFNNNNFSINFILQDLFDTYDFKQLKEFVCYDI